MLLPKFYKTHQPKINREKKNNRNREKGDEGKTGSRCGDEENLQILSNLCSLCLLFSCGKK